VVFVLILGVVNVVVPVAEVLPPVNTVYQFTVPALAVAPSDTVPVPHLDPVVVPDIVGVVFIVAVTSNLEVLSHPLTVCVA
jgi:hypothetical protein